MAPNSTETVFFYCVPQGSPEDTAYQHEIICLAEGLRALGIPFYSNVNYWWLSAENDRYLFNHNPDISHHDCSIVVFNKSWVWRNSLPKDLFHPKRSYTTVYMDLADGNRTVAWNPEYRQFDVILKAHYCNKHPYPANFRPWYFGLSERILEATENGLSFQERKQELSVNFRVNNKFPHSVRVAVVRDFLPKIQPVLAIDNSVEAFNQPPAQPFQYLQWIQTGRRHYANYYKRLKEVAASACFGGYFMSELLPDPSSRASRFSKRVISKLGIKTKSIVQWDSWRLWESLAAGSAAFHVDFDQYGFALPVMPENWKHYIGVDLDNIQATVDRLADEPDCLERIASAGQQWARQHYSPTATAERFLETVCAQGSKQHDKREDYAYHCSR